MEEQKSIREGLKELQDKANAPVYDYSRAKDTTIVYKGKKIKFRNLVKDMASVLTRQSDFSYKTNREKLLAEFKVGGVMAMNNYYVAEIMAYAERMVKEDDNAELTVCPECQEITCECN